MVQPSPNTKNITVNLPVGYRERFDKLAIGAEFKSWRNGVWEPAPSSFARKLIMEYIDREYPKIERAAQLGGVVKPQISKELVVHVEEGEEEPLESSSTDRGPAETTTTETFPAHRASSDSGMSGSATERGQAR